MHTIDPTTEASAPAVFPAPTLSASSSRTLPGAAQTPSTIEVLAPDTIPSGLDHLLTSGNFRLKEEHALIQRRTVEPAAPATETAITVSPAPVPAPAPNPYECVITAPPTATGALSRRMRNGKIARLPKLERDLVNKLIHNHVPYNKIVWALAERGIHVTERNISNWRTRGGYNEWCAEQENQLRLAHIQDHLTGYLRKNDAQQVPEVGLQLASTQLTSLLMNPQSAAALLAQPKEYARLVDTLDKCTVRLKELQQDRYEAVRQVSRRDSVANLQWNEERHVERIRQTATAQHFSQSAYDPDIPHRNDLPQRETLPNRQPGLTTGELMGISQRPELVLNREPLPHADDINPRNLDSQSGSAPAPAKTSKPVSDPPKQPQSNGFSTTS